MILKSILLIGIVWFCRADSLLKWSICMHAGDVDYDLGKAQIAFQQMQDMGFSMVRTDFEWHKFQPNATSDSHPFEPEAVNFYGKYVDFAAKHGLEVIAILSQPPSWAMDGLYKSGNVQGFLDAYKRYSKEMASLYGDRVRFFQYWNEPNNLINPINSKDRWKIYLAADQGVRSGLSNASRTSKFNVENNVIITYIGIHHGNLLEDVIGSVNYNADSIYRGTWHRELKRDFTILAKEDPNHTVRIIAIDTYPSTWSLPWGGWNPIFILDSILKDPLHPCYGFQAALSETGYSQVFGGKWLRRSEQSQSDWFAKQIPILNNTLTQSTSSNLESKWLWIGIYELYDANTNTETFFDPEALFGLYKSDRKTAKLAVSTIKSILNVITPKMK